MTSKNQMSNQKQKLNRLQKKEIIPLIAAVAVLRNFRLFRDLISLAKSNNIPYKKLYEALLQNYLFAGYPVALVSLKILKASFPDKRLGKAADMNLYHFMNQGISNCKKVYGDKFDKLILNVKSFSPDLAEWLVLEGYGKVLGRKGLSFKERELCVVSVLTAMEFEEQLYSHIVGADRAGASVKEIQIVIENVKLAGNKDMTEFGLRVFNKVKKEKGMQI